MINTVLKNLTLLQAAKPIHKTDCVPCSYCSLFFGFYFLASNYAV